MKLKRLLQMLGICLAAIVQQSCWDNSKYDPKPYVRPLEIVKLSENDYLHISYLKDDKGGYYPCNGYIRKEADEAFIFDTPLNDSIAQQLITYVQDELQATVKGVMVSHSHIDGAGGVGAFIKASIPTYSSYKTAAILAKDSIVISNVFKSQDSLQLSTSTVVMQYAGPAHTDDNAVAYIKGAEVLLGGCMIKPLNGTRGNVSDANLNEWSTTVDTLKKMYPDVKQVIPGHGGRGDVSLLDYTITMFENDKTIENASEVVQSE